MKTNTHPVDQWARAFAEGRDYYSRKYNVEVRVNTHAALVNAYFHGNLIAQRNVHGIEMSAAGYGLSPTTRQRLNALCHALGLCAPFYQHAKELWYESRPIGNSEWVTVLGPLGALAVRKGLHLIDMPMREPDPEDTKGFHIPTECGAAP